MTRQMNCRRFSRALGFLAVLIFLAAAASPESSRVYRILGPGSEPPSGAKDSYTLKELEAFGVQAVESSYFDRAMDYQHTRLRVISLAQLADRLYPGGEVDALALNCFDDYQGIVSLADVRRYDLRLATGIEVLPRFKKPGWLNPLLIVVPDGSGAPYQERFMTANIRELRFVRMEDYYAPLWEIVQGSPALREGLEAFKDNCLFCHSVKGIGGNKGILLLTAYDFSRAPDREKFKSDFAAFHGKDNPDKQNIQQFVTGALLEKIIRFLAAPGLS